MKNGTQKILILGSGPDRVGKSGELDSYAIRAIRYLKSKRYKVVWADENPMTLASSRSYSSKVYIEPMSINFLSDIIEREKPDELLYFLGGDLGVHLAILLDREGCLERNKVKVLGTAIPDLKQLMDREVLKKKLRDAGIHVLPSALGHTIEACVRHSRNLGFPIMLRPSFSLEGTGGILAYNVEEVEKLARLALNLSPVCAVHVEKAPLGSIHTALEAVHDNTSPGTIHLLGTFEALESFSVHPGNTIVFSPSLAMDSDLLEKAQEIASKLAGIFSIHGSFQVHFAVSPQKKEITVVDVTHGVNRFSSLLSSLNAIPLAEINTALALGETFVECCRNLKVEAESLKPSEGCIAARVPFLSEELMFGNHSMHGSMYSSGARLILAPSYSQIVGKSIETVLACSLLRSTEASAKKSLFPGSQRIADLFDKLQNRFFDNGYRHDYPNPSLHPIFEEVWEVLESLKSGLVEKELAEAIGKAKLLGLSIENILDLSGIDRDMLKRIESEQQTTHCLKRPGTHLDGWKSPSFSFYSQVTDETSDGLNDEIHDKSNTLLLLGSGPYRIGKGPELDLALLQTAKSLKEKGNRLILLNNNPESVSQDFAIMDEIVLGEPTVEMIETIFKQQGAGAVVHQFCPDIKTLLEGLGKRNDINFLGTPMASVKEIGHLPSLYETVSKLGIPLLSFSVAYDFVEAHRQAYMLGYPLLICLSQMDFNPPAEIIYNEDMLKSFFDEYSNRISHDDPALMTIQPEGMTLIEVIGMCDGGNAKAVSIVENVEEYGVHSGDCASIHPAFSIGQFHKSFAEDTLKNIAAHYGIRGHLSLELAVKGRSIYLTRVTPYPSRSIPFVRNATNFALHDWIARLLLGERIEDLPIDTMMPSDNFYVKESVFPFERMPHLDPILSPRMRSTGQVLGIDCTVGKAFYKAQMAANRSTPQKGKVFISARDSEKEMILQISKKLLELGFSLVSTEGTAGFLSQRGLDVDWIHKVSAGRPNVIDLIKNGEISLVINIPGGLQSRQDEHLIARAAIDYNIQLISTFSGAFFFIKGLHETKGKAPGIASNPI